jgi:hypothetical protein
VKLQDEAGLAREEIARLESELPDLQSLADVMAWGRNQPPGMIDRLVIKDVVVQDEFSHDAIVPWGKRFLVFGST